MGKIRYEVINVVTIPLYPYGYKLNYLGRKEIHKARAAVVRLIYKKYIGGMNRYAITWYLINHNILRPRGDSCAWQYSMISRILTDERYLGNEKYPAILTQEIFDAAQAVRKKEKEKAIAVLHESCNETRKYSFSGFIKCGSCGNSYTRSMQCKNSVSRKASWRCSNHHLKNEGRCNASGNIYEEMLELVCAEAYNKVLKEHIEGKICNKSKTRLYNPDKSLEILIHETIEQLKNAEGDRLRVLKDDLNVLINRRTKDEWRIAPLDLTDYETEKIKKHFDKCPIQMPKLDIDRFKEVFAMIIACEPGELKLVLKNGVEIYQKYQPMRGQMKNAQENRGYTCKADKRT